MQLVHGLILKDRVTLSDIERVFDLVKLAFIAPFFQRVHYNKEIVKTLTTKKKPRFFDITEKRIMSLLKACDLINDDPKAESKPSEELNEACAFYAVRLNKTINDIKTGTTPGELETLAIELNKKHIYDNIDHIRAAHDASAFHKDLTKQLKDVKGGKDRVRNEIQEYDEMKKRLDNNEKIKGQIYIDVVH